jgi:hypothetical protein
VSRLFPEAITVRVAPSALTVLRKRRARSAAEPQQVRCDPGTAVEPWRGAVAALMAMPLARCRLTIELSNHFVRYALVPWSEQLTTPAEEETYVRHHFARVHGDKALAWAVRASAAPTAAPRLASAVDAALIEEIKAALKGKPRVRLVSIRPLLMGAFNAWRGAVPRAGAWVVLAETGRACVALHGAAGWRSVQNARDAWRALLDRERMRLEGDVPRLVLLGGAAAPRGDTSWNFREMAS